MDPVAGWYADPAGSDLLRYWDGTTWTAHTAPKPSPVPAAPAPSTPPQPQYGEYARTPAWPAATALAAPPQYVIAVPEKNGLATRALVWAIISLVINPIALPSIMGIVFGAQALGVASQMERAGLPNAGRGRAVAAIVVGSVGALLFVILAVYYFSRN